MVRFPCATLMAGAVPTVLLLCAADASKQTDLSAILALKEAKASRFSQAEGEDMAAAVAALRAKRSGKSPQSSANTFDGILKAASGALKKEPASLWNIFNIVGGRGGRKAHAGTSDEDQLKFIFPMEVSNLTNASSGEDTLLGMSANVSWSAQWRLVSDGTATARWQSWIPWLLWERNLTTELQNKNITVKEAATKYIKSSRDLHSHEAEKRRYVNMRPAFALRVTEAETAKENYLDVVALAEQQMFGLCNVSEATLKELQQLDADVESHSARLRQAEKDAGLGALGAELEAARANVSAATERLARANQSAVDTAASAEEMSTALQAAIAKLNALNRDLRNKELNMGSKVVTTNETLDGVVVTTKVAKIDVPSAEIDEVHAQAKVVAHLTDNLTWSEILSHKAAVREAQAKAAKLAASAAAANAGKSLTLADSALQSMRRRLDILAQARLLVAAQYNASKADCVAASKRHEQLAGYVLNLTQGIQEAKNRLAVVDDKMTEAEAAALTAQETKTAASRELASAKYEAIILKHHSELVRKELAKLPGQMVFVDSSAIESMAFDPGSVADGLRQVGDSNVWRQ